MKRQKKLIVGNWKMNPTSLDDARKIATTVKRFMNSVHRTSVVICPPFVYLSPLSSLPKGSIYLGAQNANGELSGPYTGEVSFSQFYDFKVSFVILGHSERRKMGETDEIVNKKVKSVTSNRMKAIVCVGESVRDRDGEYLSVIKNQIHKALKDVNKRNLDKVIIAYEPLWAIGAKEAIGPRDLHEMSIYIRKVLKDMFGSLSDSILVIYGGDVDRVNADSLVRDGNVSGLLIGRASLRPKDFVEIIKLVDSI
jgi:triosephosphate isomerase (TIM)